MTVGQNDTPEFHGRSPPLQTPDPRKQGPPDAISVYGEYYEERGRIMLLALLRNSRCALRTAPSQPAHALWARDSHGDDAVADGVLDEVGGCVEAEGLQDVDLVDFRRPRRDVQQ